MDATTISLAEVKAKLSEMVGRARDHHERIMITVHGEPAAVLLSAYDYESMVETLDILGNPETMRAIAEGEAELAAGRGVGLDELARDLASRSEAA
ncbi:MAG: type II toxin-antitoxin system Phd/YefM family antitoxin [Actinomycetota bacterium]|nr:type II toxin-antitoxin system Phd/YefM family antitoxin [Actinomycetota bacterium]